jgi:uncharacterized OsmC-like protein
MGVLDESVARFGANPLSARTAPSVTATLSEGRGRLTGGPFSWDVDLPAVVGGTNRAPSPTSYLLGALAGCAVTFIHDTLAPQLGVRLADVNATARCRSDVRGLLGMADTDPRLTGLTVEITVESVDSPERLDALRRAWLQRCPIYLALLDPAHVEVTWASSGKEPHI